MKKKTVFIFMALAAAMFFFTNCQQERPWPSRAIQVIIPFSPGGDSDINARQYVAHLGQVLGVPVVAQNMTGLSGLVAGNHVLSAAPDGYTVLFWHNGMFGLRAAGISDLVIDDFELVAIAAVGDFTLMVEGASPFYTLQDFIDASAAAAEPLIYAVTLASVSHLTGIMLNQVGANLRIVDAGGAADRVISLLGGHIHAIPSAFGPVLPQLETGAFRALAVFNSSRNIVFTEVPTTVELGFPYAVAPMYYFFAFPRGTPSHIVEAFACALFEVNQMPAYQAGIRDSFQQAPFFLRGEEAWEILRAQQEIYYTFRDEFRR